MTKDEAIKTLREDYCGNRIICELHPDQCNQEECEIWLAIKALETQHDGDVISRQSALSIVYEIDTFQAGWRAYAMGQIEALPSAQPDLSSYSDKLWRNAYERGKAEAQAEIIRCRDCKHRDPEDKKCDCGHDIVWNLPRQDDWFCADAKRRTDGTEQP